MKRKRPSTERRERKVDSRLRPGFLRDKLIDEFVLPNKCALCGVREWNGQELELELYRINGIQTDHTTENLQLMCHNCFQLNTLSARDRANDHWPTTNKRLVWNYLVKGPVAYPRHRLARRLVREEIWRNQCHMCGIEPVWQTDRESKAAEPLRLEIHHMDGNRTNFELPNLRLLCPNCQTQAPSFAWRKRQQWKGKFWFMMVEKVFSSDTAIAEHLNLSVKVIQRWRSRENMPKAKRRRTEDADLTVQRIDDRKKKRKKRRPTKRELMRAQLVMNDRDLAKLYGRQENTVRLWRKQYGLISRRNLKRMLCVKKCKPPRRSQADSAEAEPNSNCRETF